MSNKFIKHAKISEAKFKQLVKYFALDLDGLQIAELSGLNRNTVGRYINLIRQRIAEYCEGNLPPRISNREVDITVSDEIINSNLEEHGKYKDSGIIFGLFKSSNRIYTEMVDEQYSLKFRDIVRGVSPWEAATYSVKYWYEFDGLVEIAKNKYFRLNQTNVHLLNKTSHLNSIKSFWGFAQLRLLKFRGVARRNFNLHLKECEFRFNNRDQNIYSLVMDLVKNNPL